MTDRAIRSNKQQPKIFYGWYIVAGLATISMISVGMGGMNLGLFIEPMNKELGISHATFGMTHTARAVGFSISSWFLGRILDKYGARVPMAIAALMMWGIMVAMAFIQTGWQLVVLLGLCGIIGLEGGGGNLYQSVPLSRWFILKRGRAMSITFLGITAGLFIFTPLLQFIITRFGWRFAWAAIGSCACPIIFLIAVFVIRKDPQSMGLLPDGELVKNHTEEWDKALENKDGVAPSSQTTIVFGEYSWTKTQALRSFTFWGLVLVLGLKTIAMSSLYLFRIPYFIESGFSPQLVAFAISVEAILSALIAVPTGLAMDRFQARFVMATSLALLMVTFIATINVGSIFGVFFSCGLFGLSAAMFIVSQNTLWPNYFGGMHIGSIRGIAVPFTTVFGALGAPITGAIKDTTGSYLSAWILSIVLLAIAVIIMLMNRKPIPPSASA